MSGKYPFKVYLSKAFHNVYNYIGMGLFAGLFLIESASNGLGHGLGWLMVGGGLELVYLYMLTLNPRFQRVVDSQLEDQKELQVFALRNQLWPFIEDSIRKRYLELEQLTARLRMDEAGNVGGRSMTQRELKDPLLKENMRKVATLLASYLKLGVAVTRYHNYLQHVDPDRIRKDIERLNRELESTEDERVKEVRQKNIDVLQKRLEKIEKARANVKYLEAQTDTIGDTMRLVVDQAITLSDPKGMSTQIDGLLTTLQDTELIAAEMESFEELEAGLDPVVHIARERE
ncbi:hypothetical protein IT575_14975 [bacterium]|nr:hypothetical protein [bacterium]